MKRIVGLCLFAVFALFALTVSSAFAEAPEYQVCAKAAKNGKKYTGKYKDKACSEEEVKGEGKYERASWEKAKKKAFKGKNKGNPHNNIVNPFGTREPGKGSREPGMKGKIEGTTECTKEKVTGETTGPKTTKWKTVYTGCKALETPCNTAGAKAGEIKTEELEGTLVFDNAAKTEVGPRVKGLGPGGLLAQYECVEGALDVHVYGEILAQTTGNFGKAAKTTVTSAKEGPLALQSAMYENGAFSEENGKEFIEWADEFQGCVAKVIAEFKVSKSEAETICKGIVGSPKETPPTFLLSVISGAKKAEAPGVQNGESENKGEAFLIN